MEEFQGALSEVLVMNEQKSRTAKLEAELAEYHRKDREKKERRLNRKRMIRLIIGILWKVAAVVLLIVVATYACSKVNSAFTNAVGLAVGLIGAIPAVKSVINSDLKKYKSKDENQ